jgi:predicted acyltransferase
MKEQLPGIQRNASLDVLRGFAILAMVLSSSIAFGILPAWMYHAQVPPPAHLYRPELPGITWVDLVFPFFLFSMGAAFPMAFYKRLKEGEPAWKLGGHIVQRYLLLVFFALFTFHARAWVIRQTPGVPEYLLSMACFVLLFFMYVQWKGERHKKALLAVRVLAFAGAIAFLAFIAFAREVQLHRSDVIIIVLANMALFGSIIWLATRHQPWLRIGLLPFMMAVFLGSKTEGSINNVVYTWTPFSWMYQFYYLKYLFIIIPGSFAGEWLLTRMQQTVAPRAEEGSSKFIAMASVGLVVVNTTLLFSRALLLNAVATVLLLALIGYLLYRTARNEVYVCRRHMITAGAYLLLLGLAFEAWEGGVKKDPSTYSYYFITSGLAFFALLAFDIGEGFRPLRSLTHYLALNGRNPMVAYVAGNLLLLPLLHLTGAIAAFKAMESNEWLGVLRGVVFTGIVSGVTVLCVKKKWYWKT